MKKSDISIWLMRKYLEWQQTEGELKSQAAFAEYLGVKPSTLSMWMTGKQDPDIHSADLLARKLGPEVYDVLNIPPPPEFLQKLEAFYYDSTPEQQQYLQKRIQELLDDYI